MVLASQVKKTVCLVMAVRQEKPSVKTDLALTARLTTTTIVFAHLEDVQRHVFFALTVYASRLSKNATLAIMVAHWKHLTDAPTVLVRSMLQEHSVLLLRTPALPG